MKTLSALAALLSAGALWAAEPAPGRVHNLKVLSDKIDDVTTVENILKSFVKPGMTDRERTEAIWRAAIKYRHQAPPPNEHLAADWEAHDPVKVFNTYGYCMCCCSSAIIAGLNRADGREARGRILNGHSVPEVKWGDGWHMYDASLITFFPKPDGAPASVDEIAAAVAEWHSRNPGVRGNHAKLMEVMRANGWTGWKAKGPELLAACPFYKLGYFPARTHGWDATMQEYDRKSEVYEYGYQLGHRALFSLRPGESIVREAGNRGLHVNGGAWDGLKFVAGKGDLVYVKDFLPGYNGGLVANGRHLYEPDLAAGGLAAGAEVYENLAADKAGLHAVAGKTGVAVVPIGSPYVYLGGRLTVRALRKTDADRVTISISTNNGRTFVPLWSADKTGPSEAVVDLKDRVARRYAYWLKVEIEGAAALSVMSVENDIQHAPRTLPWLGKGANTITVAADADPAIATRAITGRLNAPADFDKNETAEGLGATFENLSLANGGCWWKGGVGAMTVPVETPGDLVALRFGGHIRARGAKDVVRMLLSFDAGKTWAEAARIAGPTPGRTEFFRFDKIPPGTRRALLRFELTGNNTIGVLSFRADADYRDPSAGFRPFEVIHRWKENGREKTHRQAVGRLPFQYTIPTAADPEMVSVTYAMPR